MMEITDRVWREVAPEVEDSIEEEVIEADEFTEIDDLPISLDE